MEVTAGMKELLTYIARNLVDHPDAVSVTEHKGESETVLELRVAPEDMGKVIGRQGRIAKEIRTLMRSVAQRQGIGNFISLCTKSFYFLFDLAVFLIQLQNLVNQLQFAVLEFIADVLLYDFRVLSHKFDV